MTVGRFLIAYSNSSNYVPTTAEYLASFARHSRWDVRYLHVTHDAEMGVDLADFDAVLQSYCARLPVPSVSDTFTEAMTRYRGIKAIAVQDEYDNTDLLCERLEEIGYDIVLTCIPKDQMHRVYPPEMFPSTTFLPVLTGYVPVSLASRAPAPAFAERPITIGYRGRDIGARYGRLAFDKLEIGRRMKKICAVEGIPHDIEWTEDKRIYGDAWYAFLGNCRAVLGTESGSNVFDWDGSIAARGAVPFDVLLPELAAREALWNIGQVSPRIFEAAAMHTPMILFEGSYSGAVTPHEHYLPLAKDFSNVDWVLGELNDLDGLCAMAGRAWKHLIHSGRFSYREFVAKIDGALNDVAEARSTALRAPFAANQYNFPADDPQSLISMVETPTRAPRAPVYFYYKQANRQNMRLMAAMAQQAQTTKALSDRLAEETREHAEQMHVARLQLRASGRAA